MPASEGLPVGEQELALLLELTKAGVPFMLVGVSAAVVQGADLVTQDLGLWFRTISHPGLGEAARNVGGVFAWRNNPPLFSGPGLDGIDVVLKCDGLLDFDAEYGNALDVPLGPDLVVKVLPIDRVLASKRAANRRKDQAVIPALEAAIAAIKESPRK
ncbi:MAG TPA: hypothetical protein VN914_03505 [Polyangia bacterium]|nr:hypothetical protein [Polyangia bacterium]